MTYKVNVIWSDLRNLERVYVSKPVEPPVDGAAGLCLYQVLMATTERNLAKRKHLNFSIAEGTPGSGVGEYGIWLGTALDQLFRCTVDVFVGTEKHCTLKIGY